MTTGSSLFWNRVGHVEVEQPDGSFTRHSGLDFRFDVQMSGCTYARFSAGICGLSRNSLNSLITWPQPESYANPRHVKVFAGYEQGGESLIAEGGIFSAIPTSPPNVWLNVEACKFLESRRPIEGVEPMKQASFQGIFRKAAEVCGLTPGPLDGIRTVDVKGGKFDFAFTGSVEMLPQRLGEAFNLIVYEQDGRMLALDRKMEYTTPGDAMDVDREHGLLGIGSIEFNKATVVTRLNDAYRLFTWVNLTSERIPQANGKYWVTGIRHTGHLRGDEWRTTLTMLKQQAGGRR